ncbi:MAG: secretion protein [Clostridia bacterium]|nr:secretion protein [Clostridia bacterium]
MPSGTESTVQDTSLEAPAEEEAADVKTEAPKVEETPVDLPSDDAATEPESKPAEKEEGEEAPAKETVSEKENSSYEEKASDCPIALPACPTEGEIAIEDFEKLLPDCINAEDFSVEALEELLSRCFPNREITVEDVKTLFPDLQIPTEGDQNEATDSPAFETEPETETKPAPSVPETSKPEAKPEASAPEAPKPETSAPEAPVTSVSSYERRVVELVNEIRLENGLGELALNEELSAVAREKSRDMMEKGYFEHQSPTYGSPFDMMKAFGITYRTAGENIAMGYPTPEEVVEGWMNSPGHRANILKASFTEIGVGYVEKGHYWTQMFIG